MTCFYCKGDLKPSTTTHFVDLKKCIVIVKNVPCLECSKCGEVLQCELFLQGHGIKRDRENVTEMVSCQMKHQKIRLDKEPKEDLPVKEIYDMPPEVKEIYTEVWKIHKECANPKTDDDWERIIRRGNMLIKMHNNSKFAKELVQAMISEIEERLKK